MGKIILISAISGAGKDDFIKGILERFQSFYFPESYTTKELSERDKISTKKYVNISNEDFMEKANQNFFLEVGQSHGHHYGTPIKSLRQALYEKKDLLLEIDVKKALDLIREKEFDYGFKAQGVFLWRKFNPLDNFKTGQLLKYAEEIIRRREPDIDDENVKKRLKSATDEYLQVKKNKDLFKFIENVEGYQSAAVEEFASFYTPTFWT